MKQITRVNLVNENLVPLVGYTLPFLSTHGVDIFQGYNGPYSHFATKRGNGSFIFDDRFSLDFRLPPKTSVFAAKRGIVQVVVDN